VSAESHTPIRPDTFPPKGEVWFRVGERYLTIPNEDAWELAWELIAALLDQRYEGKS
jgi:hypothetical protein